LAPAITRTFTRAAQPLDGAVLQHPQQLHLHRQRHVVDVVEKDRAAVRELEATRAILDRARERPAFVAEELRLDQGLREQRAADGDERRMPATARLMDQGRRHLLARAALARDEHRALAVLDDAQELEHRAHPAAGPDDD
jgi:hypothetical protein